MNNRRFVAMPNGSEILRDFINIHIGTFSVFSVSSVVHFEIV